MDDMQSRTSTGDYPADSLTPPSSPSAFAGRPDGDDLVPGGAIDLDESVAQAAARETREETGIECAIAASQASTPTPGT
jgi:8-oxo-dGTP pyrophosphatase MutT (NUDIX family)